MSAHVLISGTVQGVGFRFFIRSNARRLGINGWVTNTKDNGVEALFVGTKDKIDQMIRFCRKGPMLAEVKNVEVDWSNKDAADIIGFNIIK